MSKAREYSAQEKMEIILAILKRPKKQKELLGRFGVSISTYYKWRNRFFYGGQTGLEEYKTGPKAKKVSAEATKKTQQQLKAAHNRINELATELEILKKNENWSKEG